jgi:putative SOS response-associated peptidase YedK
MCGRYNLVATGQQIMDCFSLLSLPAHRPDYNIPPGQKILAVVELWKTAATEPLICTGD